MKPQFTFPIQFADRCAVAAGRDNDLVAGVVGEFFQQCQHLSVRDSLAVVLHDRHQRAVVVEEEQSLFGLLKASQDLFTAGLQQARYGLALVILDLLQVLQEVSRPAADVVALQAVLHRLEAFQLFFERHLQRLQDGIGDFLGIVGVDYDRLPELLGHACFFAQDQNTGLV